MLLRTITLAAVMAVFLPAVFGQPIVVDTDAGPDDLMAIAFLLSQPSVRMDAITVVNGVAHVEAGARNLSRLLGLANRTEIPVFVGRNAPLRGNAEFPSEWRRIADQLPGIDLPPASQQPEHSSAVDYLLARLKERGPPVRILALGPLTNLAQAMERDASIRAAIQELVIMGGAIHVPGNLGDGGLFRTQNQSAEWNIFIDPLAARVVFRSGVPIRLIPLDATNRVGIGAEFVKQFQSQARSPLGKMVAQVFAANHQMIDQGAFYAWDPLAATALIDPAIVKASRLHVEVRLDPPEEGRTALTGGRPNARVALDADAVAFRKIFLDAFLQ